MVLRESSFDSLMSFFASRQILDASPAEAENTNSLAPSAPVAQQEDAPRLITSYDGHILHVNEGFTELSGQDIAQGIHLNELFYFNDHEGEIIDGEYTITIRGTGTELSLQFSWITDQNNQSFLVASAQNLSARDKLLQQVSNKIDQKQQEQSDHTPFLELSFDACSITDLDGSFDTINKNFTDILGYGIDDLSTKTLVDLLHPEYKAAFVNGLQALNEKEEGASHISLDAYCIDANNKAKWIEWNHKKVGDKIYSTGRDLTPLKAYKDSLKRQEKKLSEAEAIGHIGQWEWPVGSEQITFSDQLYKIFGIEQKNFKPTLDSITMMIHRDDSGRMTQVFQRAIIEQNDYDMDFRIIRPDGETRYIRCEGRCESDSEDDVIALYGIMQDVTETTKKEQDLREAKDSVERAYAAKSQFLANMSHELRTPLNAIIGFSEMMERQLLGPIGTPKYLEYISGIRESGEHLLDLISDILDMSKIEAGKYDLCVEEFNITKVIRMAIHMMEGRAIDSELKLNISSDNEELKIIADRRAVMQMVLNLMSNAMKFSHKGGNIDINLNEGKDNLSIIIKDHGIGIPANKLANITMPFEQAETDYTREYEGTGLGLSITKELAEIHGGSLKIESVLGEGTSVTIKLPLEAKEKK
jgi:two-component system cell cycle sensor histidine kinase PleC